MEASYDLGIFLAERSKALAQLVQSIGANWSHGSALGTNTTQKRIVLECSRVKFSAKMAKIELSHPAGPCSMYSMIPGS